MKLLLAARMPTTQRERLQHEFPDVEVVDCSDQRERIAEEVTDAEVAFGRLLPEQIAAARRLRFIQLPTRGVDSIVSDELRSSSIRIASIGDLYSPAMAEHVVAMVLALYRNLPTLIRRQSLKAWNPAPLSFGLLTGKTVGFIGTGTIAQYAARLLEGFGCMFVGFNRSGEAKPPIELIRPLDEVMAVGDILVNTLPLTTETRGIVDARRLATAKPKALFINVGRGKTVDECALVESLVLGRLAGAGLDVFAMEPLPETSPFWELPNVIVSSHLSGLGVDEAEGVYAVLAENLRRYRDCRPLLNQVDLNVGY